MSEAFGKPPGPLAALAYDAAAVAALLGARPGTAPISAPPRWPTRAASREPPGCFASGPDGLSERSYAIMEVGPDRVKQVSAASRAFAGPVGEARLRDPPETN